MKSKGRIIIATVLAGTLLMGCAKMDNGIKNPSFKEAINQGAQNLNTAMDKITATPAYTLFTTDDGTMKSGNSLDSLYKVYIPLEKIKGEYVYKPAVRMDHHGLSLLRFFERTADNSQMIVRMPLSKVTHPRALRHFDEEDSVLANNFSITVSDYHNNYNGYFDFDYALTSAISIDDVFAGNLDIISQKSPVNGVHYASQYAFDASYTAKYKYDSGDTTISSFSITGDDKVLYEEKLLTIRNDTLRFGREHQYILTIGDVQITRNSATHAVEVSVNGVLQPNATVTVIDRDEDDEASICKKRDILITFEDGTTAKVSELIGASIDNIKTLFDSLHQVYFAAYVVDWIAYDVYYQRN